MLLPAVHGEADGGGKARAEDEAMAERRRQQLVAEGFVDWDAAGLS